MPSADDSSSARPSGSSSRADQLAYYKAQYEQLESELSDFQASSRELEVELEKEIEASEKRERQLKEKVDTLRYEVDEWKTKYKQSKSEGNAAQNTLQKEITTLRDASRTLQLKLRDIEVANDDYERQARHTTSSLEDMEYKFNVAIERGVLLEEEIRGGDQEREGLRIENQRLRDELSDLKIEAEIVQEKLRNLEGGRRKATPSLYRSPSTPQTPQMFSRSIGPSTVSSPLFSTPPSKLSMASLTATPPSPPISESSTSMRKSIATPGFPHTKASATSQLGSRSLYGPRVSNRQPHARATSVATYSHSSSQNTQSTQNTQNTHNGHSSVNGRSTSSISSHPSFSWNTKFTYTPQNKANTANKVNDSNRPAGMPKSGSLYQIRGLIGKMQKLEERVQSAKSKLPAPSDSPSRGSSRSGSVMGESPVASTITVRRNSRKRLSGSSFNSSVREGDGLPPFLPSSRQSFGTRTQGDSRPSSRTSYSSRSSVSQSTHPSVTPSTRPESRQSRTKTPLGHYSTNPITESRRPRSSLSNHAAPTAPVNGMDDIDEVEDLALQMSVRAKISEARRTSSSNPPNHGGVKKRTVSGMSAIPTPRTLRISSGMDRREGSMAPPARKPTMTDLGETF